MSTSAIDPDLTPLDLLARQQQTIDNLTETVELLQDQVENLRRRVQELEGAPQSEGEPPEQADD
jgi:uncharacterized coiled-coil protein SlyX